MFSMKLELCRDRFPVTEDPMKFRKGVYCIEDNFLEFWFRFVLPNRSRIELRDTKYLLDNILDALPDYASTTFESIGSEFLQGMGRSGKLPATFTHWGKWWDRMNEIDIVALNNDTLDILSASVSGKKEKAILISLNTSWIRRLQLNGSMKIEKNILLLSQRQDLQEMR